MRHLIWLLSVFFLFACTPAMQAPGDEATRQQEAERLVRLSLTDRLVDNVEKYNREQIALFLVDKGLSQADAEKLVSAEMQALMPEEHQRLVEALTPIYRRYYTPDEIHQLLSFYQSDVARKSLEVSTRIAGEGREYVRAWNDNFSEKLLEKISGKVQKVGEDAPASPE